MLGVSQHKSFPYCHVVFPNPNQSIVHYQLLYQLLGVTHCAQLYTLTLLLSITPIFGKRLY